MSMPHVTEFTHPELAEPPLNGGKARALAGLLSPTVFDEGSHRGWPVNRDWQPEAIGCFLCMGMHSFVVQVPLVDNGSHGNSAGQQLKGDDGKAEDIHFLIVGLAFHDLCQQHKADVSSERSFPSYDMPSGQSST